MLPVTTKDKTGSKAERRPGRKRLFQKQTHAQTLTHREQCTFPFWDSRHYTTYFVFLEVNCSIWKKTKKNIYNQEIKKKIFKSLLKGFYFLSFGLHSIHLQFLAWCSNRINVLKNRLLVQSTQQSTVKEWNEDISLCTTAWTRVHLLKLVDLFGH